MQEHSGQVRGQARAPVGRSGGWGRGWLWTRWTLRFPYDSTTPDPTFPTSALYRRHPSAQRAPLRRARASGQPCAVLCTCHSQRTLSSSSSSPIRKVPCFYWTMGTSGGVSPLLLPTPALSTGFVVALPCSAGTLCLDPPKGPWENSSPQFSRPVCK